MTDQPHYFRRVGPQRFAPSVHVGGAWVASEQHISPLGVPAVMAQKTTRFA